MYGHLTQKIYVLCKITRSVFTRCTHTRISTQISTQGYRKSNFNVKFLNFFDENF